MKKLIIILSFIVFTFTYSRPVAAIYDPMSHPNNIFGVHILDPNEVDKVPGLTNNNGGDWGYVTVPIQPTDRDQDKWQTFMHYCRDHHLIPIIRITTIPLGGTWEQGKDTDLVDFANFLSELDWPINNRYIVLFNEVNRETEWGGNVDPAAYARIVKNAYTIFKGRSDHFFLLGPALDDALPNSSSSLSSVNYLRAMQVEVPEIWTYFDGWAAHSYPNPGFSASPGKTGWMSITSYRTAFSTLKIAPKPVFITETGWDQNKVSDRMLDSYWRQAFVKWSQDKQVVAVTPFVLQGGKQFGEFSFYNEQGEMKPTGRIIQDLSKQSGSPEISGPLPTPTPKSTDDLGHTASGSNEIFKNNTFSLRIENFFRRLFGLQAKQFLRIGTNFLTVETAETPKEWEHGLSDRAGLDPDTGMLFIFPNAHVPLFLMKDMKFSIDIVWIKEGKVVSVEPNVPLPVNGKLPTYSPAVAVDQVLEVPAGYVADHGIVPGTQVEITE